MDSTPRLGLLPTELLIQIFHHLHPSSAIALKQANQRFHSLGPLSYCDINDIHNYLREREFAPQNINRYRACFSCCSLQPAAMVISNRVSPTGRFTWRPYSLDAYHGLRGRPVIYSDYNQGCCVYCALRKEMIAPNNVFSVVWGKDKMVFCVVCLKVQPAFCVKCRWCVECAGGGRKRKAKIVLRTEGGAGYVVVSLFNRCWEHVWYYNFASMSVATVKTDRLLALRWRAVRALDIVNVGIVGDETFGTVDEAEQVGFPALGACTSSAREVENITRSAVGIAAPFLPPSSNYERAQI